MPWNHVKDILNSIFERINNWRALLQPQTDEKAKEINEKEETLVHTESTYNQSRVGTEKLISLLHATILLNFTLTAFNQTDLIETKVRSLNYPLI